MAADPGAPGLPALAAVLLAINPQGLGGAALRGPASAARQAWLNGFQALLPPHTPLRRVPAHISDNALLGGLDLGATLQAGRPVAQRGVLAQVDGGLVLLPMAERLPPGTAARLAQVLDTGRLPLIGAGADPATPVRLGVLALDEGASDDEQMPSALADRLAFHLQLQGGSDEDMDGWWQAEDVAQARARLPGVSAPDEVLQALCGTALALGIDSLRAPLLALRTACAIAALNGEDSVSPDHASLAVALVLSPRATRLPASDTVEPTAEPPAETPAEPPAEATAEPPAENTPRDDTDQTPQDEPALSDEALADVLLQAAQAALPAGLLAALRAGQATRSRAPAGGRSGAASLGHTRGRPLGARRGLPRGGARLSVIDTLRAAAPWQRLRSPPTAQAEASPASPRRLQVRSEDFHVTRYKQTRQTTTVFVVDASGSAALHRLAEAKGAVELLLAECYVRRDRVAVLAFRGAGAELLLPPTRSLARAKRCLAALPGGGGTPLAHAIDAASALVEQVLRQGDSPVLVWLTDGRANIARDGSPGRTKATDEALAAARQLRLPGVCSLLLDTSPQAQPSARQLADAMGATYLPLPHAGAAGMAQAVRLATPQRT